MKYKVNIEKRTLRKLKKMDRNDRAFLIAWIDKNLKNVEDPREKGKALKGDFKVLWRYRVGNYRIITEIKDAELYILIIDLGHRKDIYK